MLFYFIVIISVCSLAFFLFSFLEERKYRNKPYYKLADVGWRKGCPPADAQKVYSVAFLGDVGAVATDGTDPVMQMLEHWQQENPTAGTAVFLGDNIYPVGLPPQGSMHYETATARLNTILNVVKSGAIRPVFLSGNHDWNKGRKGGYEQMLRQQEYVVEALQDKNSYLPPNGCPGPSTVQLADGLLLLIINTQWWVQRGEKPMGTKNGCSYDDIEQFYLELNKILRRNTHQRILVAAHHPLYSNALHGGKFTIKQHIFPLTAAHKRFYIPLPIFGSLYPFYRKLFGAYEDMSHRKYKRMRKRLLQIFHRYSNIIYVAGHDHNLQHFEIRKNHYIVSGSGSKTSFVKKGGRATFTLEQLGFFVINYYDNGAIWMETRVADTENNNKRGNIAFRKELKSTIQVQQEKMEV
ncbi:metallophosphoesterase [Pontibacter sp. SGAir0037]|uniref:metallophosphoesterase family protein n=1 Tax=Pontibacter sp. SGAir0037 TaxID=2571030 RepID=UPI0010CD43C9|nr:metallophosphoesterase [Pontibacter sp. SGAir0037]QCR21675.1 metallophosphoesterase [Pontibacter sp. SGAir0037]